MAGVNRASLTVSFNERQITKSKNKFCVFISHQKSDGLIAKVVADYLLSANIDVYFDEYDKDLRLARESNDPKKVTESIRLGIEASSHMLCIVSANTLYSKWVPFEVGYGYDKTYLAILIAKDLGVEDIPDYVKAAPLILPDIYDLNLLVARLRGVSKDEILLEDIKKAYDSNYNPLKYFIAPFRIL